MIYASKTDGINHRTGRPVRLFARMGRWWVHFEVGNCAFGGFR